MSKPTFQITITIDDVGQMNIQHPGGASELRDCVYFLELAKGALMAKSMKPPENGKIIPARIIPNVH